MDLALFKHILNCLPGHIYWKDLNGRFLGCNKNQADTFELKSPDDVIGTTDYDYYPHEYAAQVVENDKRVVRTKTLQIVEEPVIHAGNRKRIYLSQKLPLQDASGNILGILGISFDITERKEEEEKHTLNNEFVRRLGQEAMGKKIDATQSIAQTAEEMRDYLENIIALMPGHVYWQDCNNVFLGCNDFQAKNAGLKSRKEIVGKTNRDMIWKDQADVLNKANEQVRKTRQPFVAEEFAVMANGPKHYLSHKVPLIDKKGGMLGTLGISLDITERKEMEEALRVEKQRAEQASQAKSQFIMNMSHDVRTPLSGIIGMAEILSDHVQDEEGKKLVQYILKSGKRFSVLLDEILEFSRMDNNQEEQSVSVVNVRQLVADIVDLVSASIYAKHLKFELDINVNLPDKIVICRRHLYRIILNLLNNAIRFTESGKIRLAISLAPQPINCLKIVVQDSGAGIPQNKFDVIFEPFSRLNPAYEGKHQGVGLGLYMVKKFVENCRGKIFVESEEGKGSIFTCLIPFSLDYDSVELTNAKNPRATLDLKPMLALHRNKNLKILVVDDDEICRLVTSKMLKKLHHDVETAASGGEVLRKLHAMTYDFILMDIGLPDIDGCEVTRRVRALENNDQHAIIVGLTAHVFPEYKQKCLDAGMDTVLFKPFSLNDFLYLLKAYDISRKGQFKY